MTEDNELPEVDHGSDGPRRGASDAPLVERVRAGDQNAFGELYDRWFDRVLDLAYRILWDENAAADVAQDAFLSAWRNLASLEDAGAFGGWLLHIARNGALDRKRKEHRSRPVDQEQLAMIERAQTRPEDRIGSLDDPARVTEDASYAALLWDAAEALGERDRDVLDLSLRHGLEPAEIADVIGLNRNAANQLVHRVRQRLGTAVGARVLWRDGQPTCSALRAELAAAGVDEFGADAVRVTDRHAGGCDECGERRQTHLSPAQLFSALPILVIPALKAQAAFALSAAGVPMAGSTALDDKEPVRHGRVRRGLLAGGVVVAVVIFALFMGAGALDRDPSVVAPVASTTSSSTSTSTSVTTAPATSTVPATVPVVVTTNPPTTIPTTTSTTAPRATTTTTAVVRATISLSPPTVTSQYAMQAGSAPQLTWTVTGASATRMYDGPGALDSTQGSGSQLVCPGAVRGGVCFAKSGTYAYTLDAFDSTGTRVVHRALTLTIN